MSNLAKTVQLATKPKRAPPKAKYIDPIVQATFNQDGALQEIVRTLSTRLRDSNTTVVFKSLVVLHQLLRAGSLEPTFSYLASSSLSLTLSAHEAPNISAYGHYLAARIKSYSNIKRDVIRDKSDRRAASRLRGLKVEGGLLRETREVQRMIAALVESKFYTDDVDDEVSMTALRFLVKDLLVLFTAVNEGVINVLEHYFEMSHVDATTALKIYKTFCRDTEKVVAYLGIAKKLQNVTHIQIPNLKHAPVSLAGSLEEYLNDPNFETNRREYKENKRIADGGAPSKATTTAPTTTPASSSTPAASTSTSTSAPAPASFTDFFESIEAAQQPMFAQSPGPNSQFFAPQQTGFAPNPFLQSQMTGMPFQPQMTGMPGPFGAPNPFGMGLQPQATGFPILQQQPTGFPQQQQLQPQMTGGPNPFRQSMMMTGNGGGSPFGQGAFSIGAGGVPPVPQMPAGSFGQMQGQQQQPMVSQSTGAFGNGGGGGPFGQPQQQPQQPQQQQSSSPFGNLVPQPTGAPFSQPPSSPFAPNRVSSPFSSSAPPNSTNAPSPAPLVSQKTGARNPFAPAPGTVLPQFEPPKQVQQSMNALAMGAFSQQQGQQGQQQQPQQQQPQQQQPQQSDAFSSIFGQQQQQTPAPLTQSKTGGLMASIGSEFALSSNANGHGASSGAATINGHSSSLPPFSSAPFSSAFSSPPTSSPAPLTSQPTGFGGSTMKPFQPTSSFGSKLADEFGAPSGLASSSATLPAINSSSFAPSSFSPAPLSAQQTGGAAFNPFRAGSVLPPLNGSLSAQPTGFSPSPSSPSPFGAPSAGAGGLTPQRTGFQPTSAFGQATFGGGAGGAGGGGSLI